MDIRTPSLRLCTSETDGGVVIVWTCPQCQEPRDFHLIVRNAALSFVDLAFSKSEDMLDLRCAHCAYEFKVAPSERPMLDASKKLTAGLKAGTLKSDAYRNELKTIPAAFLKDLVALTDVWKCPQCGEENPASFESCWKCEPQSTGNGEEPADRGEPLPGFFQGGNAWEK